MPNSAIRVGLIGFGFVSKTFHVPLLKATHGYRITAVSSSRPADVKAILPDAEVVADPKVLATHPNIDLVVIASPNETHAPLAELAIGAGRNVVVDNPDVRDRWREVPGPGAGLLYDLGPHLIDQTLLLFGIPDSVQATLAKQRRGARTDDFFQLVLRYGETVATLQAGSLVSGGSARFSVHGDRESILKQKPDVQEDQLRAGVLPGSRDWGLDPDDAVLYDGATGDTRAVKAARGDQRRYYVALREALQGRAPNPVPPAQGATVMAIIEAALRSDEEGRRVVPALTEEERAAWVS